MLDKYGVGQDPYCYPGSSVLRNRLDLHDEASLHEAERELSEIAVASLCLYPPPYDLERLQHIHRTLFGDIYDWAGELRMVNIQKANIKDISHITNALYLLVQDGCDLLEAAQTGLIQHTTADTVKRTPSQHPHS